MDLVLTERLRRKLKRPLGRLVSDLNEAKDDLKSRYVISVGDKVTENLLAINIVPDVCVCDGKTKRVESGMHPKVLGLAAQEIRIKNPAGRITPAAFKALGDAVSSAKKTKIIVSGEEDLLALAAIKLAPTGAVVLYGQPGEGAVIVEAGDKTKKKVEKILEEMTKR